MPNRPIEVRLLRQVGVNIPEALNIAVASSMGAFVIRIDGHSRVPVNYVRDISRALQLGVGDVVGPSICMIPGSTTSEARAIAAVLNSRVGNGGTASRNAPDGPVEVEHTVMSCYRREVWEKTGGYDSRLEANEDFEFDYRAHRLGFRIVSLPNPRYEIFARSRLRDLRRQRWRYGYWKGRVLAENPESLHLRQAVPLLAIPLAAILAWWAFPLVVLLAIGYAFVVMGGIAQEMRGSRFAEGLQFAVVGLIAAMIVHFIWAMGVWLGVAEGLVNRFRSRSGLSGQLAGQ